MDSTDREIRDQLSNLMDDGKEELLEDFIQRYAARSDHHFSARSIDTAVLVIQQAYAQARKEA